MFKFILVFLFSFSAFAEYAFNISCHSQTFDWNKNNASYFVYIDFDFVNGKAVFNSEMFFKPNKVSHDQARLRAYVSEDVRTYMSSDFANNFAIFHDDSEIYTLSIPRFTDEPNVEGLLVGSLQVIQEKMYCNITLEE